MLIWYEFEEESQICVSEIRNGRTSEDECEGLLRIKPSVICYFDPLPVGILF